MKKCRKCAASPVDKEFPKNLRFKDGLDSICKECKRKESNERHAKRSDQEKKLRWQKSYYPHKYGISKDEYDSMVKAQQGKCYICSSKDKINLAVDHCHINGNVRGLLCMMCNRGLGLFKDDPALLRVAAKYLESNRLA